MNIYTSTITANNIFRSSRATPSTKPKHIAPAARITRTPFKQDLMLHQRIAECAYYIAEKRLFIGGDSVQDWLKAEQMINCYAH
jgi:hypothetical protein